MTDEQKAGKAGKAVSPDVVQAKAELEAARAAAATSLDELTAAAQSALDIPAKIRRNPVKTAALAGGAGFLIVGGPRRVLRFVGRRVRPATRDLDDGLLPHEIEHVLRDSGVAGHPEVRQALEADFADYLRRKGRTEPEPDATTTLWRTFDRVAGPLGTVGARLMVMRIMEAEKGRIAARSRARREASGGP